MDDILKANIVQISGVDHPSIEYCLLVKGACSDPRAHLLNFFKHNGTRSWVVFTRLYVWGIMHKLGVG